MRTLRAAPLPLRPATTPILRHRRHLRCDTDLPNSPFLLSPHTQRFSEPSSTVNHHDMPNAKRKRAKKFAVAKRTISPNDTRLKIKQISKDSAAPILQKESDATKLANSQVPASMFFRYNPNLGPPFRILLDTNFINFSVSNKLDIIRAALDCLSAQSTIYISECVIAELQKLPKKYNLALRVARDRRFKLLKCTHKGTYADDCIVDRITSHRIYIVATCDKDLKRRIRKIPGIPIMYISGHKFKVERLPETLSPGLS